MLVFFLLLFLQIFLSGCVFEDVERRAFVTAIGLDHSDVPGKKYSLLLKISLSKSDPKSIGSESTILQVNCNSIGEGFERLQSMSDKRLEFGHVKALLVGEKLAKQEIVLPLAYFMERPDIQKVAYVGVAKPGVAALLQFKPKEEAVAGSLLYYSFERSRTQSPYVIPVPLYDANRRITNPGLDLALPVMELNQGALQINKMALFDKKRLQEELTPEESKLLKLITTGVRENTITLQGGDSTYNVTINKGKTTYRLTEGTASQTAIMRIKMQGTLVEKMDDLGLITAQTKRELERQAQEQIQKKVQKLLVKLSSEHLDPVGFGLRDRSRHFDHTKDTPSWQAMYPHLHFEVRPTFTIEEK